ncbi:hypothetical protein Nepgr_011033 [Nepenthes gracilis]|uniref:Uncharacterized protein n=1 Tax=Nepenthes gracilis TaxID=150966 RepID=A0AAD3XLK7_NEPGR|nr:hypothetical protein Nepgr_011033 [Nepenthes gracilis]
MQRQSLGSPGPKLHTHGGDAVKADDQKRRESTSSSSPTAAADDDEIKLDKLQRSQPRPERFIHIIPILTLVCFLILYLSSHEPSETVLVRSNAFKHLSGPIDSTDFGRFLDKGEILGIRSHRNLQEITKDTQKSRSHRKLGDF